MKKGFIVIFALIILLIVCMNIQTIKSNSEKQTSDDTSDARGMEVILLGGSNELTKGNLNSMGYAIINAKNELILVDGGRDIDSEIVKFYIDKYGNGTVDHWFITHPHIDHTGALDKLLDEDNNLIVENLYYSFLTAEWYEENDKRGYEHTLKVFESLSNPKIKNKIECKENQIIKIDNLEVDIIRVPNPEITNSDNGNEASMCFKVTATDVNKSILFLGDAFLRASVELLEKSERLKADAVQMAHHGQNGVTKEVYQAINPDICFFNCPEWLWNNDKGTGYNTGKWKTVEVRGWMEELGTTNYKSFEGDQIFHFTNDGIVKIDENGTNNSNEEKIDNKIDNKI